MNGGFHDGIHTFHPKVSLALQIHCGRLDISYSWRNRWVPLGSQRRRTHAHLGTLLLSIEEPVQDAPVSGSALAVAFGSVFLAGTSGLRAELLQELIRWQGGRPHLHSEKRLWVAHPCGVEAVKKPFEFQSCKKRIVP
jgi:hypothetical protein